MMPVRGAGRRRRVLVAAAGLLLLAGSAVLLLAPRAPELGACRGAGQGDPAARPPAGATPVPEGVPWEAHAAVVVRVVDGDGICVRATGAVPLQAGVHEVRVLGINAPGKGRCGSEEASAFTRSRIGEGKTVFLLGDELDRDRYGRFLRYVWYGQGAFFNVEAVREGAARSLVRAPNERYADAIREAEEAARDAGAGVWRCMPWRLLRRLP